METQRLTVISALIILLSVGCASRVPNVALIVGNGAYTHTTPLPNPARDAVAVGRMLDNMGWSVTTVSDLARLDFDQVVDQFVARVAEADQAIFFYAGHGMQIDGKNYIVPISFEPSVEGLNDLIALEGILERLSESEAQLVVVLDACRDNPLSGKLERDLASEANRGLRIILDRGSEHAGAPARVSRQSVIGKGLAELSVSSGTLIAYATQPGNVALDGEGQHSPFTAAILSHAGTAEVEISAALRRIRLSVIEDTDGQQVPWDHSSLTKAFIINPRNTPPPPP